MPQALTLDATPPKSIKRQRSPDTRDSQSRPESSAQNRLGHDGEALLRQSGMKVPAYLTKSRAEIAITFHELEWKQRYRLLEPSKSPESIYRTDQSRQFVNRNRYHNVLPWDSRRIKLKLPIGGADYINASPISFKTQTAQMSKNADEITKSKAPRTPLETDGFEYIAAQGPKAGQFLHFWQMVMQETTGPLGIVVMLTELFEGNREKCAQYFPLDMDDPVLILTTENEVLTESEDLDENDSEKSQSKDATPKSTTTEIGRVTLISLERNDDLACDIRDLKLTINGDTKDIRHFFYNKWADFSKPEAEDRAALVQLTKVTRDIAGSTPRIVHCSAGVGRTGTWIAMDFLLKELEEGRITQSSEAEENKDSIEKPVRETQTWGKSGPPRASTPEIKEDQDLIFETVNTLREQRMMMVMNELQYSFLYDVLKEAFMEKYSAKETGPMVIEEPTPKVARKEAPLEGTHEGTKVIQASDAEDTVSEAETEIMENERKVAEMQRNSDDPYADVAMGTGTQDPNQV